MMNSARSPWKPLICNFPRAYDNFLQMQSPEELERATAEVGAVNPGWNATKMVENDIYQSLIEENYKSFNKLKYFCLILRLN